jgi:transposase
MRDELSHFEWIAHQADAAEQNAWRSAHNDRRVLNGIFSVLRSGAPWRDLPEALAIHDMLQSPYSSAKGWRLGPAHGCTDCGSRCRSY